MNITIGDGDAFELDALDELYMADDFTLSDVFSPELPPIEDTPAASAAFSSFVDELEALTTPPPLQPETGNALALQPSPEPLDIINNSMVMPTGLPPQTMGALALGPDTLLGPAAQLLAAHAGRDADYPDVLDAQALVAHALPLNIAADARPDAALPRVSAPPRALSAFLPGAGTLARRLAAPRTWGAPPNAAAPVRTGPPPTAAARGRPRVREMRHPGGTPGSGAKLRYSKGAAPSKYCHVCGRSAKTVSVALCGNNRLGLCRKVVCDKCLLMHQRDSWDVAKAPGSDWICMHCRARCPERARCHQYQRNNLKRRMRGAASPPLQDVRTRAPRRNATSSTPSTSSRISKPTRAAARRVVRAIPAHGATLEATSVLPPSAIAAPSTDSGSAGMSASNTSMHDEISGAVGVDECVSMGVMQEMAVKEEEEEETEEAEEAEEVEEAEGAEEEEEEEEDICMMNGEGSKIEEDILGADNGEESQTVISEQSEMKHGIESCDVSRNAENGAVEDVSPVSVAEAAVAFGEATEEICDGEIAKVSDSTV